jgi:hypothetical protein
MTMMTLHLTLGPDFHRHPTANGFLIVLFVRGGATGGGVDCQHD